ncbi:group II intron reverse transcriptase/maturase [Lactobacillus johnsonii]|uniref:RNA-directed DNA polymerase n=1 Tax=Lactobacillus johnsonii TaxID=33959 RepID=A0A9X6RW56_LACJH|nr:group II intron reverse transcriptase/maturase [Lactobacillus johnsonii]OYS04651.1 group II intron reverse transcriptase/maturase [Lactobacillus johnsonii]OYS07489.1 group II intron reverse transcriptase/maturase [Lactobacillus johnsonii]OYS09328.1 group II intron reverse transcriptase/maturase [Lactobacillus johnsonii]OYS09636.1 group II intron reverse transcriptase/maturase [Lactobacillus johnsonii]OYS12097.1 group II intron reverse transcriptase/maturase [Lactobacillus johnsonii]
MELIDQILSQSNLKEAIKRVKANKGAAGVDKRTIYEIDDYFKKHQVEIKQSIRAMKYKPQAVRRVYIPKANGKKRPLGIPTVVDRVIQQAISQVLMKIYDPEFSAYSYGFRPKRSSHDAMEQVLEYLDEGYQWVIDLDIEKYFDTVNHDKLISTLREQINDKTTLHLIRSFLKAGIMEDGLVKPNKLGVPQGGPLSPILSNIYLDKFDKELEERGLHFVRYADDCNIFVKSKMSADRVMKSATSWLERKLFLKVNATKTKVVRPTKSNFLGFTFFKTGEKWQCKPGDDRKKKLYEKLKLVLCRRKAVAMPLSPIFTKVNQIVRGWINYFRIGSIKVFLFKFGQWMRHKIRVIIIKQWKLPKRIYTNLMRINKVFRCGFSDEDIHKTANTRLGLYKRCTGNVINYLLSPKVLGIKKAERPGLIDPLEYYLTR